MCRVATIEFQGRGMNQDPNFVQVESGKLILEETEFELGRELEGLTDMFSVQRINHNVETVLDLSGIILTVSCLS